MPFTCQRYHDFSAGHRVVGHESKCALLHGHNYRVTFVATPDELTLDDVGRVVDFAVLKRLAEWLEENWDHKMLLWDHDPVMEEVSVTHGIIWNSVVRVPFNPTAENMAEYILTHVGPRVLQGFGVHLITCTVEETRKCAATYSL